MKQTIIDTAAEINVTLERDDIDTCFRMGKFNDRNGHRPIMVRLRSKGKKVDLMKKKKTLGNGKFIEEDLTKLRSSIYFAVRKDPNTSKSWTIEGKICAMVKRGSTEEKVTFSSPHDLTKLGWDENRIESLLNSIRR